MPLGSTKWIRKEFFMSSNNMEITKLANRFRLEPDLFQRATETGSLDGYQLVVVQAAIALFNEISFSVEHFQPLYSNDHL